LGGDSIAWSDKGGGLISEKPVNSKGKRTNKNGVVSILFKKRPGRLEVFGESILKKKRATQGEKGCRGNSGG